MADADVNEILGRILAKARVNPVDASEMAPPCGSFPLVADETGKFEPHRTYCDGKVHYAASEKTHRPPVTGRCPYAIAAEIRERIDAERQRLAGALQLAGGGRFDGYDVRRTKESRRALDAMVRFSEGRPPKSGVVLSGTTGTGKSRLLLASHFALLAAGVDTTYITAGQLRPLFRKQFSFNEVAQEEAASSLDRIASAAAIHLDDIGDVRGSEAFHADFQAGLLQLLGVERRGAVAVAFNCTAKEAAGHPDIGDRVLSRLVDGASIVRLEGADQRVAARAGR